MLNFSRVVGARSGFEVYLKRKETAPAEAARRRVEYVQAADKEEAKAAALARNENGLLFRVESVREVRA